MTGWLARFLPRNASIGSRLFMAVAAWSILILLVAGLVLTTVYRSAAERNFDERLGVYVKELIADLASPPDSERDGLGDLGEPRFLLPLSGWYWHVIRTEATDFDFRGSRSLVGAQLPRLEKQGVAMGRNGLRVAYRSGPEDRMLRVVERLIDTGEDGRFVVAVAGPANELTDDIREFSRTLIVTFALLGAALLASTAFAVRFGLAPLTRLRHSIEDIRTGKAQHIEGHYPPDIAPLAGELNLLIDSNHEILERARTQVGNLAHALKTPLSVMLNEAGSADGPLKDKVQEQVGLMRDQVQYYLDRARAAAVSGLLTSATEIEPLVDGLIRTFDKIYADRFIDADNQVPEGTMFRGEKQDFEEMAGNLLDNAFKWAKSEVVISVAPVEGTQPPMLAILVDNDGPPLSPEAAQDVLKRGRRLDETKPGSGLGLSIVVDLAKLYGGRLALEESPQGGVRARLVLPTT